MTSEKNLSSGKYPNYRLDLKKLILKLFDFAIEPFYSLTLSKDDIAIPIVR